MECTLSLNGVHSIALRSALRFLDLYEHTFWCPFFPQKGTIEHKTQLFSVVFVFYAQLILLCAEITLPLHKISTTVQ